MGFLTQHASTCKHTLAQKKKTWKSHPPCLESSNICTSMCLHLQSHAATFLCAILFWWRETAQSFKLINLHSMRCPKLQVAQCMSSVQSPKCAEFEHPMRTLYDSASHHHVAFFAACMLEFWALGVNWSAVNHWSSEINLLGRYLFKKLSLC